jgi:hypothetical protein
MDARLTTHTAQMIANRAERRTLDGRAHVVAPVVALVAGVVNGELVTVDELAAFAAAWNGRPVPLRHPQDAAGQFVSANSPEVIEASVIGQVFEMHVEGDRLLGEVWLDVEKCERLGGDALRALQRLEAGGVIEVSTAYFCDFEPTNGVFNGRQYTAVQRNLRPDHVALLPDEVGACSIADGCGAGRFNQSGKDAAGCGCDKLKEETVSESKDGKGVQANEEIDAGAVDAVASTTQAEGAPAASVLPAELTELAAALREFGGVSALMDAVRGIRANQEAQRAQIVGRLAANSRCAFERADLEAMTLDQLGKLEASLTPVVANYAGRNGAALAANTDAGRFVRFDEFAKKAS